MFNKNNTFSETEFSIKDIVLLFLKNIPIILIVALLFIIGSVIYAFTLSATYQSESKIVTRTSGINDGGLSQMAALAGITLGPKNSSDPSLYLSEVIKDRGFLLKIINKKWYLENIKDSIYIDTLLKVKKDSALSNWQYIYETKKINALRNGKFISLLLNKKNGIITLTTTFSTPELAYQLNNYILGQLSNYMRESYRSQAQEKRKFIESRISEVSKALSDCENELAFFNERNVNSVAPKITLQQQRLMRNVAMNQEVFLQLSKQYEMARIEEKNDQPLIELIQNPEIPILRASPDRKKIVTFSTLMGVFFAFGLVLVKQWYEINFKR